MTRKFGHHTREELDEARAIATEVIEIFGDFPNEAIWKTFREQGIWNDHAAVQAALQVIMDRNDRLEAAERERDNWKDSAALKAQGKIEAVEQLHDLAPECHDCGWHERAAVIRRQAKEGK